MAIELKGGKLLQDRLEKLAKKVRNAGTLRVGFLEGATYPDGTSVATVAATQNFGAPGAGIPPRPFFTNMIQSESPEWGEKLAKLLLANDWDGKRALDLMGAYIAGRLRVAIIELNDPALSPVTLMLRKMKDDDPGLTVTGAIVGEAARRVKAGEIGATGARAKPLEDTLHMLNSIDHEVV